MTFAHHTWFVEQGHLMTQMASQEITQIWQEGAPVTLPKGDTLGLDVVPPATVCILMEGFAKLVTMNDDGKRFALTVLRPGDFFGGLSPTTSPPPQHTPAFAQLELLEPVTDVTLVQMPQPRLKALLDANPTLNASVMQYLEGRTRLVQRKLTDMLFKDVHARIAQLLLDFCFDHGDECPYAVGLRRDVVLRHHEIAELVGASRPVTSAVLSQFLKADLLHKHDGKLCLNDVDTLQQVALNGVSAMPSTPGLALSSR